MPPVRLRVEPLSAPMVAAEPRVMRLETALVNAPTLCSEPPLLRPLPLMVNVPDLLSVTPFVSCSAEPTALDTVKALPLALRLFAPAIWIAPALIVQVPVSELLFTPPAKASTPLSFFCKVLAAALKVKAVSSVAVVNWLTSIPLAAALRLIVRPVRVYAEGLAAVPPARRRPLVALLALSLTTLEPSPNAPLDET